MSFDPSSPITGAAQTSLTSPTYTLTSDVAPESNGESWAITALGGTQTGVDTHSMSNPFTLTVARPKAYKHLGVVHPVTGRLTSVPRNPYRVITRKGVVPLSGQAAVPLQITTVIEVPAGSESADSASIEAALSMHVGALWANASGLGDTLKDGIL